MIASLVALVLAALIAHESGHALAVLAIGERPALRLSWHGPGIGWSGKGSTRARVSVALAGPAANLILTAALWALGQHLAALVSLELALWNLIPTKRSDGGHIARALRGT